jgi:hypothetical protein
LPQARAMRGRPGTESQALELERQCKTAPKGALSLLVAKRR